LSPHSIARLIAHTCQYTYDRHIARKTGLHFSSHGTPADRRKGKTPFPKTTPLRGEGNSEEGGSSRRLPAFAAEVAASAE
jgi:hypothetical protein